MICLDFDWQIDEFMVYCRSTQLREKTMKGYGQSLSFVPRALTCRAEGSIPSCMG